MKKITSIVLILLCTLSVSAHAAEYDASGHESGCLAIVDNIQRLSLSFGWNKAVIAQGGNVITQIDAESANDKIADSIAAYRKDLVKDCFKP